MFAIDIKTIRNHYNTLLEDIAKVNSDKTIKDLTTKAKTISEEGMTQVYNSKHGMVMDVVTKTINNTIFTIILNNLQDKLELSQYIHIKDHNGQIILTWNIKDEVVIYMPNFTYYSNE